MPASCTSTPDVTGPTEPFTLTDGAMTVRIDMRPFTLTVKNAKGDVLLTTVKSRGGAYAGFGANTSPPLLSANARRHASICSSQSRILRR